MNKQRFDSFIRKNLTADGRTDFGYALSKIYENYDSRQAFSRFLQEMRANYPDAFLAYSRGKGSELREQAGRYGKTPPKMASLASSSRFCYLALRDGASALGGGRAVFEHERRIDGVDGIAPQMDAFVPEDEIYVEVKCHEIFDAHHAVLKRKYWEKIYGVENAFGFPIRELPSGETFEIPLSVFGISKRTTRFDIKQFLCHLMGIASRPNRQKTARLVYLFFKPRMDCPREMEEIQQVFDELREEIRCIFRSDPIRRFLTANQIQLEAVAEYTQTMGPLRQDNMIVLF